MKNTIDFSFTHMPFERFERTCEVWNRIKRYTDPIEQARKAILADLEYGDFNTHGHREGYTLAEAIVTESELRALVKQLQIHNPKRWPEAKEPVDGDEGLVKGEITVQFSCTGERRAGEIFRAVVDILQEFEAFDELSELVLGFHESLDSEGKDKAALVRAYA
ncbi:MAG TPA: hypothetical protein VLH38_02585 [Patescibacteria group bacterium]|nr:hypothetical protein [Patescibacteria group bacterium]